MSNGDPHDPAHGDLADAARRDRDRRNPDELAERDDRTGSDGRCRRERHVLALAVDHHGHWDLREVPTERTPAPARRWGFQFVKSAANHIDSLEAGGHRARLSDRASAFRASSGRQSQRERLENAENNWGITS